MLRLLLLNIVLALTWTALQGQLDVANFVIGFAAGAGLIYLFQRLFFQPSYFRRMAPASRLLLVFGWELVKANIAVLKVVMRCRIRVRSGVIAVPTELTDELALTALANMITLTPGTLTLDISPDRRYLFVHTLNLDNPEAVKQDIQRSFKRYLRELSQ